MGIFGGQKVVGSTLAALLAVGLAGCGGGAATTVSTPSSPSTPIDSTSSSSPSAATSSTPGAALPSAGARMSQAEIQAAIVAGAPPKDLTWMPAKVPPHWERLKSETGTLEWKTREGCLLMLDQPSGIGTDPTPTSADVLEAYAERSGSAFDGKPKPTYDNRTTRKVPNIVEGLDGHALVTFREATINYGKVRSQQLAYRNGDYALTFGGFCRDAKTFAAAKSADFEPFLTKLEIHTSY